MDNIIHLTPELQATPAELKAALCWDAYREAALIAQQTLDRDDAMRAGRAWARFLDAFAVIK